MTVFDYTAPAELFVGEGRGSSGGSHMTYRRFPTSVEAIEYAVETLSPVSLNSAALVVGEDRYNGGSANSTLASSIPLAGSPFSRDSENDGHLSELGRSIKAL